MTRWHRTEFDRLPERAFMSRPGRGMTLEGGGSSTPAPDPRLVEAQVRNLGVQDDMIRQMIANANEMAPLQKEQTRFALDAQRQAWNQSQEDRGYALGRRSALTGLQDILVQDARAFNSVDRQRELRGQAVGDVSQAFGAARAQESRALQRMGVDPNSGRALAMGGQLTAAQALATAGATQKAGAAARAEGYALTDRATNALAGYPAMGMQATGQGSSFGSAAQAVANTGLAGLNAGYGQAGGLAGSAGNSATNAWSAQSNAYQQSQASSGQEAGALVGAGTTIAAAVII